MLSIFSEALKSKESCYTNLPNMLKIMDSNGNGFIDRCEDAFLQVSLGAPSGYAETYSNILPVSAYKYRCDQIFNPYW